METPLTPLEFARRARKLYPERVAVIDGDSRWTYAQFLDRCDRWSAALQKEGYGNVVPKRAGFMTHRENAIYRYEPQLSLPQSAAQRAAKK